MDNDAVSATDTDLWLVAREPWHPALWSGVALQLAAVGLLVLAGSDLYGDGLDAPAWADFTGAVTAPFALAGAAVAAWWPRRPDAVDVAGAPWLRAVWQAFFMTAIGLVLLVASLFTDASSWPAVLLIGAALGTAALGMAALMLVVAPVAIVTDVRRPGVHARWYDIASAGGLFPWVVVLASSLTWAVDGPFDRSRALAEWVGVLIGTVETREPWLAWLVRGTTVVFALMAWRVAVISRRAIAARRTR